MSAASESRATEPLPPAPPPETPTPATPRGERPSRSEKPARAQSERIGLAEWTVGLALLVGSLPGPWLTLGFPAALAFVLHDRRVGLRALALVALAAFALLSLAGPGGPTLLAVGVGGIGAALAWTASGRSGAMDTLAAPVLAGSATGWGAARLAAPGAMAAWESVLGRGVAEGGQAALDQYRSLGMDAQALAALESALGALAVWMVRLWPALAALAVWLGAWLAGRLLARWGRITPDLARRLAKRPFSTFAVGEPFAWLLIAALAGLWASERAIERLAANAALVAIVLFALDGMAVAWWWLERRRVSIGLRLVAVVLALGFALPLAAAAMVAIGLADHWIQFRDRPRHAHATGRGDR
ncbi:MAG: DUF2232 domain-containing protein [Gemmatimonadota bacterium]